jgi:hypothetical protein
MLSRVAAGDDGSVHTRHTEIPTTVGTVSA